MNHLAVRILIILCLVVIAVSVVSPWGIWFANARKSISWPAGKYHMARRRLRRLGIQIVNDSAFWSHGAMIWLVRLCWSLQILQSYPRIITRSFGVDPQALTSSKTMLHSFTLFYMQHPLLWFIIGEDCWIYSNIFDIEQDATGHGSKLDAVQYKKRPISRSIDIPKLRAAMTIDQVQFLEEPPQVMWWRLGCQPIKQVSSIAIRFQRAKESHCSYFGCRMSN